MTGKKPRRSVRSSKRAATTRRANELYAQACAALQTEQVAAALALLTEANRLQPDHPPILERLAETAHRHGESFTALTAYDRLIELDAASAETWCATGNVLTEIGEYAQAVGAYEHSVAQDAESAEAHHNLGRVLYRLGDLDRAAAHVRVSTRLSDRLTPWLSLATMIPACPSADHETIRAIRTEFGRRLADSVPAAIPPSCRHLTAAGPLRVGYLSAFFHKPNYMKPVWALINHHDRSRFQLHLFADSRAEDGLPGYFAHDLDHVHNTQALSNADLAATIAAARIDILIDLNAYSVVERLPLFTQRIAPVTVAWFNMYATSGLPGIDYLIGDDEVIRPEEDAFYTEHVLRLPLSYLTFETQHPAPELVPPPRERTGVFTFGSLVSQYKITHPVLDAWAAILQGAPEARLLLANDTLKSPHNREYVLEQFARRGIAKDRVELRGPAEHFAFLENYNDIDVSLDAFPYNGGTTTMESLWQGVPLLTFDGDRWASRTSQTLLRRAGLAAFVATDVDDYIRLAIDLASSLEAQARLTALRASLRSTLPGSEACDGPRLARSMEQLFEQLRQVALLRPQN